MDAFERRMRCKNPSGIGRAAAASRQLGRDS
jgi:hypothetical protein